MSTALTMLLASAVSAQPQMVMECNDTIGKRCAGKQMAVYPSGHKLQGL